MAKILRLFTALLAINLGVSHALAACGTNFGNQNILMIGDSISLPWLKYSDGLAGALETDGSKVARYAVGGGASHDWENKFNSAMFSQKNFKTGDTFCADNNGPNLSSGPGNEMPAINTLLSKPPKVTVISLGTNDIGDYCVAITPHVNKKTGQISAPLTQKQKDHEADIIFGAAAQLATDAAKNAASGKCFWLLPLHYTAGNYFKDCAQAFGNERGWETAFEMLKSRISQTKCTPIDSNNCPMPTAFDHPGIHPEGAGGGALGRCEGLAVEDALHGTRHAGPGTPAAR